MSIFRGRPRHGPGRKISKTVSLPEETIERLELLGQPPGGKRNLSAGIELAERLTRDLGPMGSGDLHRLRQGELERLRREASRAGWIVFELIEGPADPLPCGEQLRIDQPN